MVAEVKRLLVDGETVGGFHPDDRAVSAEHFDEEALLAYARERVAEALRPVMRELIERTEADINRPPSGELPD